MSGGDFREPRILGRTGLSTGRLGIGSSFGVGASAIERAFHEYGVNYLYWGSIRRGGMKQAVRHLSPRHRDNLIVALQSYDRTGPAMGLFFRRGLRALKIDYADVLILGLHNKVPSRRVLDRAFHLKEEGLVRFIALSSHHRPLFAQIAADPNLPIDILMIRYNAAHRGAESEVFPELPRENRPGICCYTATRWGHLLKQKRMPPGEPPLSAADCYRFVLTHTDVDLCLSGPANDEQMSDALTALELGPLSGAELERARRIGDFVHG